MYNGHIHIFNSKCAPDDFLKVGIPGEFFDGLAPAIKQLLESTRGRKLIKFLLAHGKEASRIKRVIAFMDIGVEASQRKVFERIHAVYKSHDPKYFALTLNMDFMTNKPSKHVKFDTQLTEVLKLKESYQNELLVFLSCDPRHKSGNALRDWFRSYYESGNVVGIKIYPALGYFPFDPAFNELYEYAQEHKVPVLTHTTRTGVYYIGDDLRIMVPDRPLSIAPGNPIMKSIESRIAKYKASTHRKVRWNQNFCNIFTHPENYIPMIEKFPKLKLCFAHYGGGGEILNQTDQFMKDVENDPKINWHNLVREYMLKYDNVFTDISYALADEKTHPIFLKDMGDPNLSQRIFFGTDYFMEEQEDSETNVFAKYRNSFLKDPLAYKLMTEDNPKKFLWG